MIEINKIYNQDCLVGLKNIPNDSVDMFLFSPPYDKMRDYKGFNIDLSLLGHEIYRTLKIGGVCVMVIQDQTINGHKTGTSFKTIVDWITNTKLKLFETCIYSRLGTPGNWWSKRFRVDHEYIPIFLKGDSPKVFRKEHMKVLSNTPKGTRRIGLGNRKTSGETTYSKKLYVSDGTKDQGTIFEYYSSTRETPVHSKLGKIKLQHPATFPDLLAKNFILCFTDKNDLVVDPFIGSGTTAAMCLRTERNFIGFEIAKEYCDIAEQRINYEKKDRVIKLINFTPE